MAKEEKKESKFLDKTNMSWYTKPGDSKVTFCHSIDYIIDGKGETFEYAEKLPSYKTIVKEEKKVFLNGLYLFILTDGQFVLASKRGKLR